MYSCDTICLELYVDAMTTWLTQRLIGCIPVSTFSQCIPSSLLGSGQTRDLVIYAIVDYSHCPWEPGTSMELAGKRLLLKQHA